MRIAIVNDLNLAVEALRRVISSVPDHEISWIAFNGAEAVERCKAEKPDLILMDLIMPVMDGVQATYHIMKQNPCAILVVTSTVSGNAAKVFDAMGFGALDAVCTPIFSSNGQIEGANELLRKIDIIGKLIGKDNGIYKIKPIELNLKFNQVFPMIAIGSSTGGPKALATILAKMPATLRATIVIVQHVDAQFAPGLVQWLNEQTELEINLIKDGMVPESNKAYIAGTNDHVILGADNAFHYTPEPKSYPYRPSVNVFFQSLGKFWQRKDIAILLTGMGNDGANGLNELKSLGWYTIAQDQSSSVVYGMPKAAAELNAAKEILHIDQIPKAILKFLKI